jgi:hypothetical protein
LQELEMATRMALVPDGWDLPDQLAEDGPAREPDDDGEVAPDNLDLDDELDLDGAVMAGWA